VDDVEPSERAQEALMRCELANPSMSRNYPELFQALNDVLESFPGDTLRDVLRRSVESTADGFGAQKMLLLIVEDTEPWDLRAETSRGLTPEEVAACESGRSVRGVSATCIREALSKGRPVLVQDAEHALNAPRTGAIRGRPYSVLCAPICDPRTGLTLAVLYLQNHGIPDAFGELDLAWIDVYTRALGRVVSGPGMPWVDDGAS
jgi:hypothetical protein